MTGEQEAAEEETDRAEVAGEEGRIGPEAALVLEAERLKVHRIVTPVSHEMTDAEALALAAFRRLVMAGVSAYFASGESHCKSYEGRIAVTMPQHANVSSEHEWVVELGCYVLGPSRNYRWAGPSLGAVLAEARADVERWIAEDAEERR